MPYTFNGIGTRYQGRKNVSTRKGSCALCKRISTLRSYDTQEFFCFLYVPIVPGEKYRIVDDCPICLRHRRVPLAEFRETGDTTIAPLQAAVEKNPSSAPAHANLIRALVALRLHREAEVAARAAIAAVPWLLLVQAFSGDGDALQLLGDCYVQQQRWADALAVFQSIRNPDRLVLRLIARCKTKLGRERTPEERRASHWWASDRGKHELRFGLVFAAPIVILLLVVIARGAWVSHNIAVYFDSVIPHTTFNVDGTSFAAGSQPVRKRFSPGRHHVIVTDDSGATIETRDIDLPDEGLWSSIGHPHAYVYNTLGLRVYARQTLEYARDAKDAHSSEELVAMQPFIPIDDNGYVFDTPPQKISVSWTETRTTKAAFEIAGPLELDPNTASAHAALGDELLADGAYDYAMRELAAALQSPPYDDTTLLHYTWAAIASGHARDAHAVVDRATAWNAKWLLALAEKKWQVAKQLLDDETHGELTPQSWRLNTQLYKLSEEWFWYKDCFVTAAKRPELQPAATEQRFDDTIENGDWSHASERLDEVPNARRQYLRRLYAAAASMLARDSVNATIQLRALSQTLDADEELDPATRRNVLALAAALSAGDEASARKAMHNDLSTIKHAWFFLGAHALAHGNRAHAKELFRRSASASFDLSFPMIAAQRLSS